MNLDERMREAIVGELKTEAHSLGLIGDAFWSHVWTGVEAACIESGDLPRPKPEAKASA